MKEVFSRKRGTSMIKKQSLYIYDLFKRMKYWFSTSILFSFLIESEVKYE